MGKPMPFACEDVSRTRVAVGTAPALVDRLGQITEDLGLTGTVIELNPGRPLPVEPTLRTLRIFPHEIMPAFR
jgi:hypothetical protein